MTRPIPGPDLSSHPDPTATYEDAKLTIDAFWDVESREPLAPEGPSIALLTGTRTPKAVVLFHGYTTTPRQFRVIAQGYRDAGCNVWVPRMPFHGQSDRMTRDLSQLTAQILRDHADRAVDVAAGLGERVVVAGLSGGGALATWCAVARPDVAETIAISPLMQPRGYPPTVTRALVRALSAPIVPDVYQWWYPALKGSTSGYAYPRFSLKGIASFLDLIYWTEAVAERDPFPVKGSFTLLRNDGDDRLDGAFNEALVRRLVAPERLTVVTVPADAGLIHDIITVEPWSENAERIGPAYRHISAALGIPLPDPTGA
jgi:pimeloyl-ACP methyl ester carboxylesterase